MGRLLALAAALIAGALIAWVSQTPPRPAGIDAPAADFSARRAMADVAAIGTVPHPVGSAAQAAARDRLLARMATLGLHPQVWRGRALEAEHGGGDPTLAGADVEDLVGVLPGRDRTRPALLLMAHYDSVADSPGAADDAAGVASVLETVRAIEARGAPARDVVVLITDGEEVGLIGARAFFAAHPLRSRIGFVINLEARGSSGRVQMFQTGAGNGQTIGLLRRTAVRPSAQGMSAFVYERMPNDTDFTVSRLAGLPGLNYAFVGRQFDYHTATATPRDMDPATLQDMGAQVLSTAAAAAFAPALPVASPDLVYGSTFGDLLIAYPPAVGWVLIALAAILLALAVRRAQRQEPPVRPLDALRGAAAAIYAVAAAVAVLQAARRATGVAAGFLEQQPLLAQAARWEAALALLAMGTLLFAAAELARGRRGPAVALPLIAAGVSGLFARGLDPVAMGAGVIAALVALAAFGRAAGRPGAWAGVLGLGLLIAIAVQAIAPPVAYVVSWPLLAGTLAAAATALAARRSYPALAAIAIIAAVSLGWIGGVAHLTYLSLDFPALLALPLLLAAFVLWPVAQPGEGAPPARRAGLVLLIAGLAVTAWVRLADPFTPRFPQATVVDYVLDQDTGKAWRMNLCPTLPAWARQALEGDGGRVAPLRHWLAGTPVEAAAATPVSRPSPQITLEKSPDGRLRLHAAPLAGGRIFSLRLSPDTPMTLVSVNGVAVNRPLRPGGWSRIYWEAPAEGLDLVLAPGGPGRLQVRYVDTLERWPAEVRPLPPRPANLMPFERSDATLVVGSRSLAW